MRAFVRSFASKKKTIAPPLSAFPLPKPSPSPLLTDPLPATSHAYEDQRQRVLSHHLALKEHRLRPLALRAAPVLRPAQRGVVDQARGDVGEQGGGLLLQGVAVDQVVGGGGGVVAEPAGVVQLFVLGVLLGAEH